MNHKEALQEIEGLAFRQTLDWMHFHEQAMADPFMAEAEVQAFSQRIARIATLALGKDSRIEVITSE